jgi:hypothetical protein
MAAMTIPAALRALLDARERDLFCDPDLMIAEALEFGREAGGAGKGRAQRRLSHLIRDGSEMVRPSGALARIIRQAA